jgi:hypothetical protein
MRVLGRFVSSANRGNFTQVPAETEPFSKAHPKKVERQTSVTGTSAFEPSPVRGYLVRRRLKS